MRITLRKTRRTSKRRVNPLQFFKFLVVASFCLTIFLYYKKEFPDIDIYVIALSFVWFINLYRSKLLLVTSLASFCLIMSHGQSMSLLFFPVLVSFIIHYIADNRKKIPICLKDVYRTYRKKKFSEAGFMFEKVSLERSKELFDKALTLEQAIRQGYVPKALRRSIKSQNGDGGIDAILVKGNTVYVKQNKFRPASVLGKDTVLTTDGVAQHIQNHLNSTGRGHLQVEPMIVGIFKGIDNSALYYLKTLKNEGKTFHLYDQNFFK